MKILNIPATGEELFNDEGKPIQIHVFGRASKKYRDLTDARLRDAIAANKGGKSKANDITVDKVRKDSIEWAVSLTSHISNMVYDDENGVEHKLDNPDALRLAYSDPELYFLLDQANAAIENDVNFFKP